MENTLGNLPTMQWWSRFQTSRFCSQVVNQNSYYSLVSGLTPVGGGTNLNAPFRSPLLTDSIKSTPSAEKKSSSLPKSSWSTPLLPKSRVKMGLSKPSPKVHPLSVTQSKSSIQTEVGKPAPPSSASSEYKRQTPSNKNAVLGHTNRVHKRILQSAQDGSYLSNHVERDGESDQTEDKIVFQPAGELPQSASENPEFSKEPPVLSPVRAQILDECASNSDSDSDKSHFKKSVDHLKESSLGNAHEKLDNDSVQGPFLGWDLENDQESLNCDSRRDVFLKCIPNLNNKPGRSTSPCRADDLKELQVPSNIPSKTIESSLSFVKEKFKSKRRLLSDSEGSDVAEDNCSVPSDNSQEPKDREATVPSGLSESISILKNKPKPGRPVFSESDDDGDFRISQTAVQQSQVCTANSSSSSSKESVAMDLPPDSEKENCNINNMMVKINLKNKSVRKAKALSKRRVLSDSEDENEDFREPISVTKSDRISVTEETENTSASRLQSDSTENTQKHLDLACKPSVKSSSSEQEQFRQIDEQLECEEGAITTEKVRPAPGKYVSPSNSDHNLIRKMPGSVIGSCAPDASTSGNGASTRKDASSESDEEAGDVKHAGKSEGIETGRNNSRSRIFDLSDSDDDSLFVKRPLKKRPKKENLIRETSKKRDANSPKLKLSVELCRLPESALRGFADEGLMNSGQNSQSSCGVDSADDNVKDSSSSQKNLKTYGRAALKVEKTVPKKPGSCTAPLDKSGRYIIYNIDNDINMLGIQCILYIHSILVFEETRI